MSKHKLKYYIEFSEFIDNPEDLTDEELAKTVRYVKDHLRRFVLYSGVYMQDFKLQLDLEEE